MRNRYARLFYAVLIPVVLLLGFNNCAGNDFAFIEEASVELESKKCKIHPTTDILAERFEDGDYFVTSYVRPELGSDHHQKIYFNGSSDPTNAPRWKTSGNVIEWRYNPAGAPSALASQVLTLIQASMNNWSKVCNIKFKYLGATSLSSGANQIDGTNVFGWGTAGGNTGISNTYTLNTVPIGTIDEGDTQFNSTTIKTTDQFLAAANHEIGHLIGLNHSNVQASIMFANPYNSVSYLLTLRQDDIDGCVGLYGRPVTVVPTPSPTPMPSPTPTPKPTPTPTPTASPAPSPTVSPTPLPSVTPTPENESGC